MCPWRNRRVAIKIKSAGAAKDATLRERQVEEVTLYGAEEFSQRKKKSCGGNVEKGCSAKSFLNMFAGMWYFDLL